MTAEPPRHDAAWNLRGAMFMVIGMAGLALEDTFLKLASGGLPVSQIMLTLGLLGVLTFAVLALIAGEVLLPRAVLAPAMLVRCAFEISARLFYTLAISLVPLTNASAILQAAPLVVIAGAALVFGERVSRARWLAVLVGFAGVLLILRPGGEGFGLSAIFAVLGTIGFAGRDLATRAAPPALSYRQLGIVGFSMLFVAGLIALPFGPPPVVPRPDSLLWLLGASAGGVMGYLWLTIAMRTGEISAVTPFRYTRLVFAMLIGMVVFQERPDFWMICGSVMVVAAGLWAMTSGRAARRPGNSQA